MKGVLLRVGADSTPEGGGWNAPVDLKSREYVYVPITGKEQGHQHISACPTCALTVPALSRLGVKLPAHLSPSTPMHLDPDFESLTTGEPYREESGGISSRGEQLDQLGVGDFIIYYAGFRAIGQPRRSRLPYCLFGMLTVQRKTFVADLTPEERARCAHGRRKGAEGDLVIWGDPKRSGRFPKALPVGVFSEGAYRVRPDLLEQWGHLTVHNGYLQRSARPPFFLQPERFLAWLRMQDGTTPLLKQNW